MKVNIYFGVKSVSNKLSNFIRMKIYNVANATPGNSHKNSPIKNRSNRMLENVLSSDQERELTAVPFAEREKWLLENGFATVDKNNKRLLQDQGKGIGRCAISKSEASCPEAIEGVSEKLKATINDPCPWCGELILDDNDREYGHFLAKSETEFRQHPENIAWQHRMCNAIWGVIRSVDDLKFLFKTLGKILARQDIITEMVLKAETSSKKYGFDKHNRPFLLSRKKAK